MPILFILFCAFMLVSSAEAQEPVSESDLLEAVSQDERVAAVLAEPIAIARADRVRAGIVPNIIASFEREDPDGGARQDTWSASWVPPIDGRRGLAKRAAEANLQATELDVHMSGIALREEVREAFAAWSIAHERARITASLSDSAERIIRNVQERAARGEASGLAERRFVLAGAELRADAANASAELDTARAAILAWFPSLPANATPLLPPIPPVTSPPLESDSLPTVAARRWEVQAAEASLRLQKRFYDLPELAFGWQTIEEGLSEIDGPVFGVSWPLPLFDRNQADRRLAQGRLNAARSRYELASARASARLQGAQSAYARLRAEAEAFRDIGTVADQAVQSSTAMFEAGESDATDLLETFRGALGAVNASLDLFARTLAAHRELELASGRPLPLHEGDSR